MDSIKIPLPMQWLYEPPYDKTNAITVRPAKTQIRLGIRPVDQSSLCAQWVAKDLRFLHADNEDWSDWADAQADLSLRWAHMPFCWFCHVSAIYLIAVWERVFFFFFFLIYANRGHLFRFWSQKVLLCCRSENYKTLLSQQTLLQPIGSENVQDS